MVAILTVTTGTLGGALAGGLLALWFVRPSVHRLPLNRPIDLDPTLEDRIDRAAGQWANAHGRPEAAAVVANKLRLGHRLIRKHSGWSR